MVAVLYISRTNRCLVSDKMYDAGALAVGPENEKGWSCGAEKRATSGRRYQPHRPDVVMGYVR
jgi:hypothetical protein